MRMIGTVFLGEPKHNEPRQPVRTVMMALTAISIRMMINGNITESCEIDSR